MIRTLEIVSRDLAEARSAGNEATVRELERERARYVDGVERTHYGPGAVTLRYDEQRSSASARSTPVEKPALIAEPPDLAPRPLALEVVVTAEAYRGIFEQFLFDGHEDAAWAYGHRFADSFRVEQFVRSAEARSSEGVMLDKGVRDTFAGHFAMVGWELLGDLHDHPNGRAEPSRVDRRSWRGSADEIRKPWLSLLLTPRQTWLGEDWSKPEIRGYITEPGASLVWPIQVVLETRSNS